MVLIIGNVIVMAMTHADMTADFEFGLFMVNTIFAAVFLLEAVLKLIALYPRQYFADAWNTFDFGVVCLSVVVGTDGKCSPRHQTHFEPSFLELISIL